MVRDKSQLKKFSELSNEKLHYPFRNRLLLEHIPSQFNPAHNFTPYSTGISFNIILISYLVLSQLKSIQAYETQNTTAIILNFRKNFLRHCEKLASTAEHSEILCFWPNLKVIISKKQDIQMTKNILIKSNFIYQQDITRCLKFC